MACLHIYQKDFKSLRFRNHMTGTGTCFVATSKKVLDKAAVRDKKIVERR
jgi:hypothetical protein